MKIDLLDTYSWENSNEALRQQILKVAVLDAGVEVRIYPGLANAVNEICLGAALFYSHKKQFGFVSGTTWAFEAVIPHLLKENFRQIETPVFSDAAAFIEKLGPEVNFVLSSSDHPVTGEIYPEFDAELARSRIFSIKVSHSQYLHQWPSVSNYAVQICSVDENLAVAFVGSRFRAPPLAVHRQKWTPADVVQRWTAAQETKASIKSATALQQIEAFETEICREFPDVQQWTWSEASRRTPDRAVLWSSKLSAEFMSDHFVEAISRCRRHPVPDLAKWWRPGLSEEQERGLMLISLPACQDSDWRKTFKARLRQELMTA
jgi:hypothetical protein